jgi:hypothetical protein
MANALTSTPDVRDAGFDAWGAMTGTPAWDPRLTGASAGPTMGLRVPITQQNDPAPVAGAGAELLDDWRDIFNWRNSPAPWVLLAIVVAVGLVHVSVHTRVGKAGG